MIRSAPRPAGRRPYTLMIAVAVPILWLISASIGRTGPPPAEAEPLPAVSSGGTLAATARPASNAAAIPVIAQRHAGTARLELQPQRVTAAAQQIESVGPALGLARLRRAQTGVEPDAARNPFEFAAREVLAQPKRSRRLSMAPRELPAAAPAEMPPMIPLVLLGVATSRVDGRIERTAVISGPADTLLYPREGEIVIARYRAESIQPQSLLLVDLVTGVPTRLMIR